MKYIIDRIENDIAICQNPESKEVIEVDIEELSQEAKEGSVIILEDGKYIIDKKEEMKIRKRIEDKMNKIWI
ncbi:MAG: DUF3006 domain-containing protein [Clostridia bacterium]|nr:DUF3006 domain-containing protein [Clostridia bacterium]